MTGMMIDATRDLIAPWTDVVHTGDRTKPYKPVDHEPLLITLRVLIRSSTGGNTSGATVDSERSILNLEAFALWEQITQDVMFLTKKHTKDRPNPMLGAAVRMLSERLDALWNSNQITESDYLSAVRRARSWRTRIWGILHKPREKELEFCPACEQSRIVNADGEVQAALVAYYAQGTEPTAKCRHCGTEWVGEGALIVLGKMIGAELDEAALEEMGAI